MNWVIKVLGKPVSQLHIRSHYRKLCQRLNVGVASSIMYPVYVLTGPVITALDFVDHVPVNCESKAANPEWIQQESVSSDTTLA
jgi:hypothetical protein